MLWKVRALLDDRPGAMAALAASCGDQGVNILGLQIFPAADGRVVDELVLHTPGGWSGTDVEQLCVLAGVETPAVAACSPHALEDEPVRYLRAAQVVAERPEQLQEQLCRLLEASPGEGLPGFDSLTLTAEDGVSLSLSRATAFTDTEVARAQELQRLASTASASVATATVARHGAATTHVGRRTTPSVRTRRSAVPMAPASREAAPAGADQVTLRSGSVADTDAIVALHGRCSSETLYRRYHAPIAQVTPRMVRAQLEPTGGRSMVLSVGDRVVAVAMYSVDPASTEPRTVEVGMMVEDSWQQQGHGARLMHALAVQAADQGVETLACLVQPENDAVLRTIRRAGLRARVSFVDGLTEYRIPVANLAGSGEAARRRRSNRPEMGEVTKPLVALLQGRPELREVYPPAALIDQAVRGGA
jgi:GNAT superfamily N-acetyltransferase